ncbi:hypothetical protein GOP47_0007885 [Adiantum capillus-veneris]|uniref:Uncharacterized protein n=1 Tax=Adiantum capillus-veneris TaxID=13818 RepID=A0A9D4V1J9_ADICA|nr:hypothetical protein GOP47_0007885 [Adiantum capillus-veneris]
MSSCRCAEALTILSTKVFDVEEREVLKTQNMCASSLQNNPLSDAADRDKNDVAWVDIKIMDSGRQHYYSVQARRKHEKSSAQDKSAYGQDSTMVGVEWSCRSRMVLPIPHIVLKRMRQYARMSGEKATSTLLDSKPSFYPLSK